MTMMLALRSDNSGCAWESAPGEPPWEAETRQFNHGGLLQGSYVRDGS